MNWAAEFKASCCCTKAWGQPPILFGCRKAQATPMPFRQKPTRFSGLGESLTVTLFSCAGKASPANGKCGLGLLSKKTGSCVA